MTSQQAKLFRGQAKNKSKVSVVQQPSPGAAYTASNVEAGPSGLQPFGL